MRVVTVATVATVVRLLHDDPGRYTRRRRGVGWGRRGRGGGGGEEGGRRCVSEVCSSLAGER